MNNEEQTSPLEPVENDLVYDDEELAPPEEENEAGIVNTASIAAAILVVVMVIFFIIFIAMNTGKRSKQKKPSSELDKAGTKTVIEFKDRTQPSEPAVKETPDDSRTEKNDTDIDKVLDSLPAEIKAPSQSSKDKSAVTTETRKSSQVAERPDTKNSKSPRKIEGLSSLNFTSQKQNQQVVNQTLSENYGNSSYGQKMSKEEYIANQMAQTQRIQNQLYGSENGNENFSSSSGSNTGKGTFLSKTSLWDGTIISGALITAINTDNPGVVMARVTENVYSSQDHSYLLIPEGSVLMATYNSSIEFGQNKVQVAWNLLIRPDNYRIQLGSMNGVDNQGASGYKGSVSNHSLEVMKALGMVAVYSIIQTETANDIKKEKNEYLQNAMTDVYTEAAKLGNKMVNRALDIKPTLKIKEGTEIKIITNNPLELPPVEVFQATQKYLRTKK